MRWKSARLLCKAVLEYTEDIETPGVDVSELKSFECGHIWDELIDPGKWDDKDHPCPACGEEKGVRIPFANIAQASYPDGTTNRFADIKERRKLEIAARKARRAGNKSEESALLKEREKLRIAKNGVISK